MNIKFQKISESLDEWKKICFLKTEMWTKFGLILNTVKNAHQVVIQMHFVLVDNFLHDKN